MTKRMLIDATHPEETRVAVVDGNRLVDFDYESKARKQLKGSIFLAKVTRVEPSLQAAFVNFGGNRHGFLPFSEIHPDYFRIPIADREALLAAQQAEIDARRAREEEEARQDGEDGLADPHDDGNGDEGADRTYDMPDDEDLDIEDLGGEDVTARDEDKAGERRHSASGEGENEADAGAENEDREWRDNESDGQDMPVGDVSRTEEGGNDSGSGHSRRRRRGRGRYGRRDRMPARSRQVELTGEDEGDQPIHSSFRRNYKIQEVIKRGQIMLVQASREERGNKGAAVTTYLSLPGRYCVLMPNSQRSGGVSRKVANFEERQRMREILRELEVPEGMSVIMRTAGVSRTKPEIKRDLDYLTKLWDSIRELTLKSVAPSVIHEEGKLIRRAIRDIYGRDIEEIYVAGDEGYEIARDFMKMMIPSHVKKVIHYTDEQIPLFHRYQVESQISAMGEPTVTLKSGGYLVINPTEALVSIDVNSGRATRERHIEETALKTNLEAAEEVARQLRLRDLGGLIVVDFIDMEDRRNNRKVENRLKDALAHDRARIQMGRISPFGLLELSRQRLNPSLTEAQFERCSHCDGVGYVRSVDSATITALRALEEEGIKGRASEIVLNLASRIALYILNNKRAMLADIERRYGFSVLIRVDDALAPSGFKIEPVKGEPAPRHSAREADEERDSPQNGDDDSVSESAQSSAEERHRGDTHDSPNDRRGGRRRGRRGGRGRGRGGFPRSDDPGHRHERSFRHEAPATHEQSRDSVEERSSVSARHGHQHDDRNHDRPNHEPRPVADISLRREESQRAEPAPPQRVETFARDERTSSPREYEIVNEPPAAKKKGWWNKLVE